MYCLIILRILKPYSAEMHSDYFFTKKGHDFRKRMIFVKIIEKCGRSGWEPSTIPNLKPSIMSSICRQLFITEVINKVEFQTFFIIDMIIIRLYLYQVISLICYRHLTPIMYIQLQFTHEQEKDCLVHFKNF